MAPRDPESVQFAIVGEATLAQAARVQFALAQACYDLEGVYLDIREDEITSPSILVDRVETRDQSPKFVIRAESIADFLEEGGMTEISAKYEAEDYERILLRVSRHYRNAVFPDMKKTTPLRSVFGDSVYQRGGGVLGVDPVSFILFMGQPRDEILIQIETAHQEDRSFKFGKTRMRRLQMMRERLMGDLGIDDDMLALLQAFVESDRPFKDKSKV